MSKLSDLRYSMVKSAFKEFPSDPIAAGNYAESRYRQYVGRELSIGELHSLEYEIEKARQLQNENSKLKVNATAEAYRNLKG